MAPSRGPRAAPKALTCTVLFLLACGAALAAPPAEPAKEARRQFAFGDASAASAQKYLFLESEHPFVIPLVINVGLIGFEATNNGALNFTISSSDFEALLQKHLPTHQPSVFETQEPLRVQYQISYNVVHINAFHLRRLEEAARRGLRPTGETGIVEGYDGKRPIYDLDVAAVEEALDRAYMTYFGYAAEAHSRFARQEMFPYAVLILSPAKPLMAPADLPLDGSPHPFLYRYFHRGAGPTQSWLARRRYVVVDLSAGPVQYGPTRVGEGTVSHRTLPRVDDAFASDDAEARAVAEAASRGRRADFADAPGAGLGPHGRPVSPQRRAGLLGQLAAAVSVAVQYVFAPDLRFDCLEAAERVLVPVVVLRSHREFDPLSPSSPAAYRLNATRLEAALARLALPGQTLTLVAGTHYLYDHRHVALSLAKATRAHTAPHAPAASARYGAGRALRIDGATLAHELAHAADLLAGPLIGPHQPPLARAAAASAKGKGGAPPGTSLGTRVLPVYVFSVAGLPPDTLLDGAAPVYATHDMVLVLQGDAEGGAPLPFFAGGGLAAGSERPVRAEVRQVLRHAVAGAAASLGALVAPYERYSRPHRRPVANYLFAHGEHPFGPFSNSTELSEVLVDHVGRNALLARLHAALGALRAATHRVDHFAQEYVYDGSGEVVGAHGAGPARGAWLDRLYHAAREGGPLRGPLARAVVERLHGDLTRLEAQLVELAQLLHGFRLEEAAQRAASLLVAARGFHAYALQQLAVAAADVRCCHVRHAAKEPTAPGLTGLPSGPAAVLLGLVALAGGGAAAWLLPSRARSARRRRPD